MSYEEHVLQQVVPWIRERYDPVDIGVSIAVAGLFSAVGFSTDLIALFLALVVVTPIVETVLERFDPPPGLAWTAFGLAWLAAGVVQLRARSPWLGSALLAIGCWIWLDGLYSWQHGGSADADARGATADADADTDTDTDDPSRAEVARMAGHNRRVTKALRDADRPLTTAELRSRTGLSEADLERVLSEHARGESGPIDRVGNGYVLDESDTGLVPFLRAAVRLVGGRLLRPFRLLRPSG
ncbi:hypothetical protein [Halopiger xanaduensis]|uniref:Uncharacterized protein n=1 Tax=Halopiger xanaduensis (strain DSM 18323 / JCM 14033 / SH-6) TaxID=797210 RepID=F8DC51_HALXS|nr:hypothetical protein [Halopiger xanaduensis]AEH37164.1 hypothetical protein Halxa_2546 [Halopiger xanaduensis SH-6]